jgi:hypothetical protein
LALPYDFLKLAHFLADDPSVVADELHDAALRTAWRLRTPMSDPWDDDIWFKAVDEIKDERRAEALRQFARTAEVSPPAILASTTVPKDAYEARKIVDG